ncbi:chemotaxis protein CheX [bacterium]|nr:chemotaxis protein CheX [bacterium]
MSGAQMSMREWLEAAETSAQELVTTALGYEKFEVIGRLTEVPLKKIGAYIPLVGDGETAKMEIGILSDPEGCQALSRSLLGMADTEPVTTADVADAIGEMANILAGSIKRLVADRVSSPQIGLPFFFDGMVHFKEPLATAVSNSLWGTVNVLLVVLQRGESGGQKQ